MRAAFCALALLAAACSPSAAQTDTWSPIEVTAVPFEMPDQVGQLRFVAGFELQSPQARFGGFSDLAILYQGRQRSNPRLLAISDAGEWLLADIQLDPETGVPTGVSNARMALMRDENGDPFPDKESGDAEDMDLLVDGRVAVSFEQTQTIRIYDVLGAGPMAPAQPGPPLAATDRLGPNRGLEALTAVGNGLVVGAERGRRAGPLPIWQTSITATQPALPSYEMVAPLGYGLTSLDGSWAVQRFYAPGLGTRVRVLATQLWPLDAARAPNEPTDVVYTELAVIAAPLIVDNIEGIAEDHAVDRRIWLMSDDNFSADQRTLLYVFDVPIQSGEPSQAPID